MGTNKNKCAVRTLGAALLCTGMSVCPQAASAQQVIDQALIAQAIRSPQGKAERIVPGASFLSITRSSEPVHVMVSVLQRFKQFECARVQIDIAQEKVPTQTGELITFKMPPVSANICTDGNPPDGSKERLPEGNLPPSFWKGAK